MEDAKVFIRENGEADATGVAGSIPWWSFTKTALSIALLRLTGELRDWLLFRVTVEPDASNGLQKTSQVMVDKPAAVPKPKIGQRIGRLDDASMQAVSVAFGCFHGLGEGK